MIEPIFYIGQIVPAILLLIAVSFVLFLMSMKSESGFDFPKFYYTIVSFASIVGMVIAFGIVIYQIALGRLVSNDEYINGQYGWETQQCSDPYFRSVPIPVKEGEVPTPKTAEEIAECEAKATQRLIIQRSYRKKMSLIGGLIRGIIFRVLYMTHYPRMEGFAGKRMAPLFGKDEEISTPVKKKTTRKPAAKKKAPAKKIVAKKTSKKITKKK